MRLEQSKLNPLGEFLLSIPDDGIVLSRENLETLGRVFQHGGLVAESHNEVLDLLYSFSEWYKLTSIEKVDNYYILRKINGN